MVARESGGVKVLRGLGIAVAIVVALVLVAVFWRQALDGLGALWNYLVDRIPDQGAQRTSILVYLGLCVLLGVIFSQAGHFTAYGIVMGLGPLLWFVFWEGFPPLGLNPTWTDTLGLDHMSPSQVILWAIVADVVITLVFVPLELREKYRVRRRRLGN
jgi:hypothetical protein